MSQPHLPAQVGRQLERGRETRQDMVWADTGDRIDGHGGGRGRHPGLACASISMPPNMEATKATCDETRSISTAR